MTDHEHPADRIPVDPVQNERIGVKGDPTPDAEYGDDPDERPPHVAPDGDGDDEISPSVRNFAHRLAEPGILSERQALAYTLRDIEGVSRKETAELMDSSVSNLDTLYHRAKSNIGNARKTLQMLDFADDAGE